MIYDFQTVTVKSFTDEKDSYGQRRKNVSSTREVEMIIKNYSREKVEDIRFVEATDIGLTFDRNISDQNQVISTSGTYNVLYVIPSKRFYQVFLKKVG